MSGWSTGIDLGTTHLRAVVLRWRGGRWAWHRAVSIPRVDDRGHRRDSAEMFRLLRRSIRLRGPVRLIDSTLSQLVRFVSHPPVDTDRLQRGMRMELVQHSDGEGNLAADFVVLPVDGEDLTVCCCLAQPAEVDALMSLSDRYRLGVDSLAPPMSAIADCFAAFVATSLDDDPDRVVPPPSPIGDDDADTPAAGEDPVEDDVSAPPADTVTLLLDIGASGCRVVLMRNREFLACRSLPIGGRKFSEDLAEARGIELLEAERLKITGAASPPVVTAAEAVEVDPGEETDGLFDAEEESADAVAEGLVEPDPDAPSPGEVTLSIGNRQLGPELRRAAEALFMQVSSTINWFRAQLRQPRLHIDRVLCAGAAARLPGLDAYLARRFRLPVRVIGAAELAAVAGRRPEGSDDYTIALGAAVPAGQRALPLDLRSQDRQYRDLLRAQVVRPWVAAVLVLAAGIVACAGLHLRHRSERERLAVYQRQEEQHDALRSELMDLRSWRDDIQEDLRDIAGRIFSGRDLLNTIRVIKEQAPDELWITQLRTEGLTSAGGAAEVGDPIDRGSVHLRGRVRPLEQGAAFRIIRLEQWCDSIVSWRPDGSSKPLFARHDIDFRTGTLDSRTDSPEALRQALTNEEFTFAVRFDLLPTRLDTVTSQREIDNGEGR